MGPPLRYSLSKQNRIMEIRQRGKETSLDMHKIFQRIKNLFLFLKSFKKYIKISKRENNYVIILNKIHQQCK